MADVDFSFSWIPNGYGARLQRNAVLYELAGPCHSAKDIVGKTSRLVGMWRARLHALKQIGWRPGARIKDTQYARNCPPTFVYATPHTRQCRTRHLCPFCYARWVREIWERIDETFPNPRSEAECTRVASDSTNTIEEGIRETRFSSDGTHHDRPLRSINLGGDQSHEDVARDFPFHLLVRSIERSHPFSRGRDGETYVDYAAHLLSQLAEARAFTIQKMDTLGSFAFTNLVPEADHWQMIHREIHIVRADYEPPVNVTGTIKRVERPSRKRIFQSVAKACKYPRQLMFGDVEMTKVALEARRKLRLSASYGCFRRNHRSL